MAGNGSEGGEELDGVVVGTGRRCGQALTWLTRPGRGAKAGGHAGNRGQGAAPGASWSTKKGGWV